MNASPCAATHASTRPGSFRCLEFKPESVPRRRNAIVWLHGIGERGNDLPSVAKYGLPAALSQGRVVSDADVICPQLEADLEWDPGRVSELAWSLAKHYETMVVVGFSLGGLGVCELLARCGPVANLHVALAAQTPSEVTAAQAGTQFLSLCGEHDQWPPMAQFVRELRSRGAAPEHAMIPHAGHYISETALQHPMLTHALAGLGIALKWQGNPI